MQTEEVWKDIPGYSGRYQASNLGRVRSTNKEVTKSNGVVSFYKGKILKTFVGTGGYLYIVIAKKPNKFCTRRLHRVIAETFIPNPLNLPQINHINEDKADNRACNLEWCTGSYNTNYGHRAEKFALSMRNNPTLSKEVNQYDLEGNYLRSFPSAAEAARYLNLDGKTAGCRIGQCCRHLFSRGNSAYGFLWEFTTPDNKGIPIGKVQIGIPVYQYSLDNCLIKRWDNIRTAAQTLKLSEGNIIRACKYNRTCGGFKWNKSLFISKN